MFLVPSNNKMKWIIFNSLLIIGAVWCQQDILDSLPNIPDLNVNDLETTAVENYAKDALTILKQKCSNTTGGDEVYNELESKTKALQTFIIENINFTQVMSELEIAKKSGSMDEVFAKYCARKPEAMERLKNITETFKKCLLPDEQRSVDIKLNLTEKMVHFLCEKDGDKIAMFIANGGEECLTSKVEGLQECFNKSSNIWPSENWQSLTLNEVDEKVCDEYPILENCVVTVLEECKVKTPANIIGALFKYLRKNMECAPKRDPIVAPDGRTLVGFITSNRVKRNQVNDIPRSRIETKCLKNNPSNPQTYNNLNATFNNFLSGLGDSLFGTSGDCLGLKRDTELRMESFLINLKLCLTFKEDFLPKFIRNSFEDVFEYLCDNNGKRLKEYKDARGLQCLAGSDMRRFSNCVKPTSAHSSDGGEVILKETEFCNDVTEIRKCMEKQLLSTCSEDPRFKKISETLLKKINDRCSGCSILVNSFLVFALMFFHLRQYLY